MESFLKICQSLSEQINLLSLRHTKILLLSNIIHKLHINLLIITVFICLFLKVSTKLGHHQGVYKIANKY
jgi:hypothetical protein